MAMIIKNTAADFEADNQALIQIVLDYIRGHSLETIIPRLKEFNVACKARYQAITHDDKAIERILDELSVGGCQLHLVRVDLAKKEKRTNIYVWDNGTLTYLQSGKADKIIALKDNELLVKFINALTFESKSQTLHLCFRQIETLITLNSDPAHAPHITDHDQIHHYKSSRNLYDLLKKLENKHPRLSALIDAIDEVKPARRWWLYGMIAAVMTASTGLIFYLKENFSLVKAWYEKTRPIVSRMLHNTVYMLKKTPLLGILFLGLPLIHSWYQANMDGSISDTNKLIRLLFKTAVNTLPIAGYLLCYFAAGAMTLPAVALFITGAVIDVIEPLYTLLYHEIDRYFNPLAPATEYHSQSAIACADNTHERNLYIFLVKFTANLLAATSVVIWCVFPPNLMIALTCLAFSTLVSMTKGLLVSNIKNNYAMALQSTLKKIFASPSNVDVDIEKQQLKQENKELKQEKRELLIEKNLIAKIRDKDRTEWMSFFSNNKQLGIVQSPNETDDKIDNIGYNQSLK